jgi:electron transport complex protein RnfB
VRAPARPAGRRGAAAWIRPPAVEAPRQLAFVDESRCIGCTLCIQACPVDAIIGARQAHAHGDRAAVHGLRAVRAACPVDCIVLENASGDATGWDGVVDRAHADEARTRYAAHRARLARRRARRGRRAGSDGGRNRRRRRAADHKRRPRPPRPPASSEVAPAVPPDPKRAAIAAALARARARLEK